MDDAARAFNCAPAGTQADARAAWGRPMLGGLCAGGLGAGGLGAGGRCWGGLGAGSAAQGRPVRAPPPGQNQRPVAEARKVIGPNPSEAV